MAGTSPSKVDGLQSSPAQPDEKIGTSGDAHGPDVNATVSSSKSTKVDTSPSHPDQEASPPVGSGEIHSEEPSSISKEQEVTDNSHDLKSQEVDSSADNPEKGSDAVADPHEAPVVDDSSIPKEQAVDSSLTHSDKVDGLGDSHEEHVKDDLAIPKTEGKESTPKTEEQESIPTTTEEKESAPNTEEKEPAPKTEEKESTPKTEEKESIPKTEEKESAPKTEEKEPTPTAEEKEPTPKTEEKESAPETEEKESAPKTEEKESAPNTEEKEPAPNTEEKESTSKTEEKESTPKTGEKESTSKTNEQESTLADLEEEADTLGDALIAYVEVEIDPANLNLHPSLEFATYRVNNIIVGRDRRVLFHNFAEQLVRRQDIRYQGFEWDLQFAWTNETSATNTYTRTVTEGLRVREGTETESNFGIGAGFRGLSFTAGGSTKRFSERETSRTVEIRKEVPVPAHSRTLFYQKRYIFRTEVWFWQHVPAWTTHNPFGVGRNGDATRIVEVANTDVHAEEYATLHRELSGTGNISATTVPAPGDDPRTHRQFQNITKQARNMLNRWGIRG